MQIPELQSQYLPVPLRSLSITFFDVKPLYYSSSNTHMKLSDKIFLISIMIFALAACNGIGSSDDDNSDTTTISGYVDSMSQYNDDLENSETDNQRTHAAGILDGRIVPDNDTMTIRCMDSAMSRNPRTRQFYFKVLSVIVAKADGPLAEITSGYLKTIFNSYPAEFLAFYRDPQTTKEAVEDFLAFEFEGVMTNEQEVYFADIQKACTNCSAADRQLIETLKKKIAAKAHHQTITDEPQE